MCSTVKHWCDKPLIRFHSVGFLARYDWPHSRNAPLMRWEETVQEMTCPRIVTDCHSLNFWKLEDWPSVRERTTEWITGFTRPGRILKYKEMRISKLKNHLLLYTEAIRKLWFTVHVYILMSIKRIYISFNSEREGEREREREREREGEREWGGGGGGKGENLKAIERVYIDKTAQTHCHCRSLSEFRHVGI